MSSFKFQAESSKYQHLQQPQKHPSAGKYAQSLSFFRIGPDHLVGNFSSPRLQGANTRKTPHLGHAAAGS
jgi:hypothetical protein